MTDAVGREGEPELALAEGMRFEGLLVLPRAARIDGRVRGEVCAKGAVEVGATGFVEANLQASAVLIEGHVVGDVRAREAITLGAEAVVRGSLVAPKLVMAEGAVVDGACHCGGRPPGAAERLETARETPDSAPAAS